VPDIQAKNLETAVRNFHDGGNDQIFLAEAEKLFGIPNTDDLPLNALLALHQEFGLSNYAYEGTAFAEIREIFRSLEIAPDQTFMDIGAGYGAVVLYGAAIFQAGFSAVEAVAWRAAHIERMARKFRLNNLEVLRQAAGDTDHAQADYIFLNNPFLGEGNRTYLKLLRRQIRKSCVIVAINNIVAEFRQSPDFAELDHRARIPAYKFGMFAPL
jgi:hypothetical protein